jgi:hypothetical protein
MKSSFWVAVGTYALLSAVPAASETVVNLKYHSDPIQMMGQSIPAKDEVHSYWFGSEGVRFDQGESTVITNLDQKKFFMVSHPDKTYSLLGLPIDLKKSLPPETAAMMDQMLQMMGATTKITPLEKTGNFAGYSCKYYRVEVGMPMMTTVMDQCLSNKLPIELSRYRELVITQGQIFPNAKWMIEFAKLEGFPIRTESSVTMMGKTFSSWSELIGVEEKPAPPGLYLPPAGYKEIPFDPMAASQQRRKK